MAPGLGESRQTLRQRYTEIAKKLKNPTRPDQFSDRAEKFVIAILTELGIDYPIEFLTPGPEVPKVARQGTFELRPNGTTILDGGGSPPVAGDPKDNKVFTFKARDGGVLVIQSLDFIMETRPGDENVTIEYVFAEQANSVNHQCVQSDDEPGMWKFNKIILADGECMTITVTNNNALASAIFSMESVMWMI